MLQQGLLERIEGLHRSLDHYPYGVIEAELASDAFAAGKIRFVRLQAVLPNGLEVTVPEDCNPGDLAVKEAIARSPSGELTIMLGVPDYAVNAQNTCPPGASANRQVNFRYIPGDEARADENTGNTPAQIKVRTVNARLLFEHESRSGLECLPLLKVRRASAGTGTDFRIELVPGFAPPCRYLPQPEISRATERGGSPPGQTGYDLSMPHRLSREVYLSIQRVETARRQLSGRMQDERLDMGALQGVQFQRWVRLLALSRYSARLQSLQLAPLTTPFEMFLALYEALRELEASQPRRGPARAGGGLEYNHEDALGTFMRLRTRLEKALEEIGEFDYHRADFEPHPADRHLVNASLGGEFFADNVVAWYLSVKTSTALEELIPVMRDRMLFELTTPTRIGQGWGGLQLGHRPNPPPGLPIEPDIFYFQVQPSDDAVERTVWEEVKQDRRLSINRSIPGLDLNNAAFTFYGIQQQKASFTDNIE
jgi:type VI secretion system protein ImpJ